MSLYLPAAQANQSLTTYFVNDSINGLQISDAYETHNMGLIYSNNEFEIQLDLGIVTPDMHIYKNEYRQANRAYGELITVTYRNKLETDVNDPLYTRFKVSGDFGFSKAQDLFHNLFALQPVGEINELVMMPNDAWFGLGYQQEKLLYSDTSFSSDTYIGTDTAFLDVAIGLNAGSSTLPAVVTAGAKYVFYDNIVSAPPIYAKERAIIPYFGIGTTFSVNQFEVSILNQWSLPTIEDDQSPFGVLSVQSKFSF